MSTDGVTFSCPLRKNRNPGPVRSRASWGRAGHRPRNYRVARVGDGCVSIRFLQKRPVRLVRGRAAAVRGTADHRFSPVLVERGGGNDLAVRLDLSALRFGAHGRAQTL